MSTPFQNRLVGTVIVAAIAIIFLPDILDGEKKTYQEEFDQIPNAPSVNFQATGKQLDQDKFSQLSQETLSDEKALDDDSLDEQPLAGQQESDENSSESTNDVKNTAVKVTSLEKKSAIVDSASEQVNTTSVTEQNTDKLPERAITKEAWVIQLGSFRHKKNVDELLKKLKDNGYTAFSRPIKTRTGNLTKVFIGPELIKASLEKKIPALKKLTTVEGKIARFQPTK